MQMFFSSPETGTSARSPKPRASVLGWSPQRPSDRRSAVSGALGRGQFLAAWKFKLGGVLSSAAL
jgi:hypothetical protein